MRSSGRALLLRLRLRCVHLLSCWPFQARALRSAKFCLICGLSYWVCHAIASSKIVCIFWSVGWISLEKRNRTNLQFFELFYFKSTFNEVSVAKQGMLT